MTETNPHIYFLGIGGTLMGSLAQLAQELGYRVTGSDKALYPPMSDQLRDAGITCHEGFHPDQLTPPPDMVVVGNAGLPRGHEAVEYILEQGLPYTSGAQWLGETVLRDRWVLAVAGTHGKTTTASMLAWILEFAGLDPGYLIGGAPLNFERSARLGAAPFFVVEADEYDTSYFDRRSKFVHYRPRTLILNNLEFDHADIFDDIQAIQTQFNHLLRTVPASGLITAPSHDEHVDDVLHAGCWSQVERIGAKPPKQPIQGDLGNTWSVIDTSPSGSTRGGRQFEVALNGELQGAIDWPLLGKHNQNNALNAIAAARHAGVPVAQSIAALNEFRGVKRRMELIYENANLTIYDDFAHHPTAIRTTLEGLRKQVGGDEILAIVEPRTHTMSLGTLRNELITCCAAADRVFWFRGENIKWDLNEIVSKCVIPAKLFDDHSALIKAIAQIQPPTHSTKKTHVVIMSNGAFGGIYERLKRELTPV